MYQGLYSSFLLLKTQIHNIKNMLKKIIIRGKNAFDFLSLTFCKGFGKFIGKTKIDEKIKI